MIRLAIGIFFITLPFIELIVLVKLVYAIGFLATLALMLAAGVAGSMVIAQQSAGSFREALAAASRGETPHAAVIDGMFLMLAGVFLVIPGLVTDAMALALLIPPVRHWLAARIFDSLLRNVTVDDPEPRGPTPRADQDFAHRQRRKPAGEGPVIEGEFERLDERPAGSQRQDPPRT